MSEKNKTSFNLEDLKKIKEQVKKAHTEAKTEYKEKKDRSEEPQKQTIGNKIVGIIILIALLALVVVAILSNFELLFLPKNSVTITISDQNGDAIDGLSLYANSSNHSFTIEFDENTGTNVTELGVKPGDYTLTFENIPEHYNCTKIVDNFTMSDGDKIKLKYECTKENE